nr:MAG TPA: hypothetical protein [Caudoviricetes sp.]
MSDGAGGNRLHHMQIVSHLALIHMHLRYLGNAFPVFGRHYYKVAHLQRHRCIIAVLPWAPFTRLETAFETYFHNFWHWHSILLTYSEAKSFWRACFCSLRSAMMPASILASPRSVRLSMRTLQSVMPFLTSVKESIAPFSSLRSRLPRRRICSSSMSISAAIAFAWFSLSIVIVLFSFQNLKINNARRLMVVLHILPKPQLVL